MSSRNFQLLKQVPFVWNNVVEWAFPALKEAMCDAPTLVVPNFTETFVFECDASSRGLREMLMQLTGTWASPPMRKEMMAIFRAVETWHPYLI